VVDPYLLDRAIAAYRTWQNAWDDVSTRLHEFEEALRTLVEAGATADEVAELIPDGAGWIHYVAADANRTLNCSFCARSQRQVMKLIAGPGVYICNDCVSKLARELKSLTTRHVQSCSFCGQQRICIGSEGSAQICEECLDLCLRILREETAFTS
jgi:hypothetical protein